jgi:hypothetical protein
VNVAPERHCVLGNGTVVAAVVAAVVSTVVAAVCSGAIVVATVASVATVVSDVSSPCPFVESKHVAYQQKIICNIIEN